MTRRHSSVKALTGSSYAENCCRAWSSSRNSKFLALRRSAKGVGETVFTIMTTFGVVFNMRVGGSGGYSVWESKACSERGSCDMPLTPPASSGASDRRYAKKRWLVASAALYPVSAIYAGTSLPFILLPRMVSTIETLALIRVLEGPPACHPRQFTTAKPVHLASRGDGS